MAQHASVFALPFFINYAQPRPCLDEFTSLSLAARLLKERTGRGGVATLTGVRSGVPFWCKPSRCTCCLLATRQHPSRLTSLTPSPIAASSALPRSRPQPGTGCQLAGRGKQGSWQAPQHATGGLRPAWQSRCHRCSCIRPSCPYRCSCPRRRGSDRRWSSSRTRWCSRTSR